MENITEITIKKVWRKFNDKIHYDWLSSAAH